METRFLHPFFLPVFILPVNRPVSLSAMNFYLVILLSSQFTCPLRGLEKLVGPLRGERVLFRPENFARSLEMKWPAVVRAIRELNKLDQIDYVPPFRGRAIHMLDRKKRFAELDIDFLELERRKQAEYDKLQRMIGLATTRRCRQVQILEYFGDPDLETCGTCDNCETSPKSTGKKPKFADADACLYAVQVALSGVARSHGRFGKTVIAQMLCGSESKKVKPLAKLSTFGLLRGFRQADVSGLLEWLIEAGYLKQVESTKFRPVVQITGRGHHIISGRERIDFTGQLPITLVNKISIQLRGKTPHIVDDTEVNDKKGGYHDRKSQLETESNEPVEVKTSEAISSLETEGNLHEIGPDSGYAAVDDVIDADLFESPHIESPAATQTAPEPFQAESITRVDLPDSDLVKPSFYWTWRLLNDGYTLDQLKQVRQIDTATVFDHAIRAVENGLQVKPDWLLRQDQLEVLREIVAKHGQKRVPELIAELPSTLSGQQLMYYLKCQRKTHST